MDEKEERFWLLYQKNVKRLQDDVRVNCAPIDAINTSSHLGFKTCSCAISWSHNFVEKIK